jgi:hypothetical protein
VRRLEALVSGISRNPDISYTVVDVETVELRVRNLSPLRSHVQVEWYSTSSDDVASLVKTDSLEVAGSDHPNPLHSVAVFERANIPDGCTRCMAMIYSFDVDGPAPNYWVTDLQATVTHRVVDAGNAQASATVPTVEELFPGAPNMPRTWLLPQAYRNHPIGQHQWDTLITGCLHRTAPGAQQVSFSLAPAVGGLPVVITRSVNPGGCLALNLESLALTNGAHAVTVTAMGDFFVSALSYSTTGQTVQLANGVVPGTPVSLPADISRDGCVSVVDYNLWLTAFKTGVIPPGTFPDVNNDGVVGVVDFNLWLTAFRNGEGSC